jgi:adenylate kinase family enzyme
VGKRAAEVMKAGGLMPDDVMMTLIKGRTKEADCLPGYILDGFPRTPAQATLLDVCHFLLRHPAGLTQGCYHLNVPSTLKLLPRLSQLDF